MHTEHLHRTLSPQAYANLLDHLRQQAECEQRQAVQRHVQAFFFTLPRRLLQGIQRTGHRATRTPAIEVA